ncbi:MAG TPA: hypothetical protein VGR73_00665 [Bryobacteraceae bacterium]|nr:hypothetical protein [Bryobacteraceae bacterium]
MALLAWIPFCWQPLWGQAPSVQKNVTQNPKQKAKLATSQPQIGTEASPLIVETRTRTKSEEEAAEAKADKQHAARVERWTLIFTGAAALFTGLMVWVGWRGVSAANRTLRAIENQVDVMIATERAWILVEIGNLPEFKPDPNAFQLLWIFPMIKNYGKTTAHITRVRGIVKLISEGEQLSALPEYVKGQGFDDQVNLVLPPNVPIQPNSPCLKTLFDKIVWA